MSATTTAAGLSKPLRVWEKIELQIGEGAETGHYIARIQDFINGGIVITDPEFISGASLLRENADILVTVRRDDAMYQFASTIKRSLGTRGRQFILTPPRRFERVQRRMFVRVELHKKISYARIVPLGEWQTYDDRLAWHQTHTLDISAGGISFDVFDEIPPGNLLLLKPEYFKEVALSEFVVAIVKRCFFKDSNWHCGAQFVLADQLSSHLQPREISALPPAVTRFNRNAQNRLAADIFGLQVELRKKGLL